MYNIYLPTLLSVCLSVSLSVSLSLCLSVALSLCLSPPIPTFLHTYIPTYCHETELPAARISRRRLIIKKKSPMRAHKSEKPFCPQTHNKNIEKMNICLPTHNQNPQELEKTVDFFSLEPATIFRNRVGLPNCPWLIIYSWKGGRLEALVAAGVFG